MITSSVLNSITFKYLDGVNPNKLNTLHANRKQEAFKVIPYCQPFNIGEKIYLINRKPDVTTVKVIEAKSFKTLDSFETKPSVSSLKSRISEIRKREKEVAEFETGFFKKRLVKEAEAAKVEGFSFGTKGERVSLDLGLDRKSVV